MKIIKRYIVEVRKYDDGFDLAFSETDFEFRSLTYDERRGCYLVEFELEETHISELEKELFDKLEEKLLKIRNK